MTSEQATAAASPAPDHTRRGGSGPAGRADRTEEIARLGIMDELDSVQIDEGGHPVCSDEYCPGYPDCLDCRRLRDADRQRTEGVW